MLRWLAAHGFELGDHTHDHTPARTRSTTATCSASSCEGGKVITDAVPGYRVRTMALPLGALPHTRSLALRGSWHRQSYRFAAAFLVGAEPAPSPFSTSFDRRRVPRIRTSHLPWNGERDFCAEFWLARARTSTRSTRYVSDGDPGKVTYPDAEQAQLAPTFEANAAPY